MEKFGELMRFWRKSKGFSQLELACEANVSSKHISFLETERAKPSRQMVLLLADALDLPLRNRNELLKSADFAEHYERTPFESEQMDAVRQALELIINNHNPYPAIVLDWHWNIVMANQGYTNLVNLLKQYKEDFSNSNNIVELFLHENGFRPFVKNWEDIAGVTIQRLQKEHIENRSRHKELLESIAADPGIPDQWRNVNFKSHPNPVIEVEMELEGQSLNLFTTLTSLGTPIDITAEELIIEQYYPSDDEGRELFERFG